MQISKDDLFRNVRMTALDNQKREDLYGITCLKRKERKKERKFFCHLHEKMSTIQVLKILSNSKNRIQKV